MRFVFLLMLAAGVAAAQQPQFLEASQRMRTGDYAGARTLLETVIAKSPQFAEAHNLLGVCLRKMNDAPGSIVEFRRATALDPHYRNAWLNLGSTLFELHDEPGAVSAFTRLLQFDPQSIDGHVALAKVELSQGQEKAALPHLDEVIRLDPHNVFALANAGLIESRNGRLDTAANYISRALDQDPQSTPLQLALVELYLKQGKTAQATALAGRLAKGDSLTEAQKQTLSLLLLNSGLAQQGVEFVRNEKDLGEQFSNAAMARAKQMFLTNHFKETTNILDAIRGLRQQDPELHNLLGLAAYETGDARTASDELQQAIRLEPHNPDWYFQLGLVYLKNHTPELAEVVFEHGLAQLPESGWLWLGLGLSQHLADNTARARQSVQKALLLDPGLVAGYVVLGDILEADGRLPEAKNVFLAAVEKRPDLYVGYYYCGKVALESGEGEQRQALNFLTKAIELNPDFAEAHYERGRALESLDQLQQAISEYNVSLAKDSALSQAHYRLALLYRKLGQTQNASSEFGLYQKTKLSSPDSVLKRLDYRIHP